MKRNKSPLFQETKRILYGYMIIKMLRIRYGKDTHFFLIRGKTGDIFLYFRFLESFINQNKIRKYIFIGDGKGLKTIIKLYPNLNGKCISMSEEKAEVLQKLYCFLGEKELNMTLSLMWDVSLPYNRCAVRLTDSFNFIDSYYWFLLNLDRSNVKPTNAIFKEIDTALKEKLIKKGVEKNKTVIMSPYAYCVKCLPNSFWTLLGKDLEKRGYKVFIMLDPQKEKNEFGFPTIFFTYYDSAAVLQYAGHFIGLRSGFCDIISGISCNKIILYPKKPNRFNGDVHRADAEYSSFYNMELADDALEITVPFSRDITNFEAETEEFNKRIKEDITVNKEILKRFPVLDSI